MFEIDEVILNEDGNRPVILNMPANRKLSRKEIESGLKGRLFLDKKNQKIAAMASNKLVYKGKVKPIKTSDYDDFIVEINRTTGKARLIAVEFAQLQMWNRGEKDHNKSLTNVEDEKAVQNSSTTGTDFNQQFGSKRTKRVTQQKERTQKNTENVKETMETTVVAAIELNESSVSLETTISDNSYRPVINWDASVPQDVYNLHDLVPESVLDTLEEDATQILDGDKSAENLCPFVMKHVNHLRKGTPVNRLKKCKILLYMNYLINFIAQPAKNITKRYVACASSPEVSSHIIDTFTLPSKTGRTRPLSMKDKAVCFVMILAMVALDYQIEVEPLSKDLKMSNKKILEIGRVLAFSGSGRDKSVLVLKIPLPPPLTLGAKRKR